MPLASLAAHHPIRQSLTRQLAAALAVVAGILLVVAGLTAIPARIGARRPVAGILQSELA